MPRESVFTLEANGIRVEAIRSARHRLKLEEGKRYLINPGSVGQPRDRDPRAACATFETDDDVLVLGRIPYDVAAAQRAIVDRGMPAFEASRLAYGM